MITSSFTVTMGSIYLAILTIYSVFLSRVYARVYSKGIPRVMLPHSYLYLSIGDFTANSSIACGVKCAAQENCSSYFFQETDFLQEERCFKNTTRDYTGHINVTQNGAACSIAWEGNHTFSDEITDDDFPDGSIAAAKSYCRDPLDQGYLWCIISEAYGDTCNIHECMTSRCKLFYHNFDSMAEGRDLSNEGISYFFDTESNSFY